MKPSKKRNKDQLSYEDRALWSKVTKTLTPLHTERVKPPEPEDFAELFEGKPLEKKQRTKTETAMRAPEQVTKPPSPPPLRQLEHRYRKKLVSGVKPIDARLDLHGLTQHQAHDRLRGFMYQAQASGHKVVLVITGKGKRGEGGAFMDERGVLRRVVPQWLGMPDMRSLVVGYEEAHMSHGGSGALYVRIRRRR